MIGRAPSSSSMSPALTSTDPSSKPPVYPSQNLGQIGYPSPNNSSNPILSGYNPNPSPNPLVGGYSVDTLPSSPPMNTSGYGRLGGGGGGVGVGSPKTIHHHHQHLVNNNNNNTSGGGIMGTTQPPQGPQQQQVNNHHITPQQQQQQQQPPTTTSSNASPTSSSSTPTTTTTTNNNNNPAGATATMMMTSANPNPNANPKQCAACGTKILERFLLHAMERYWHTGCLKCSCCHAQLGDLGSTCFTKQGMILCKNDYLRMFGRTGTCAVCQQGILASELVMRAGGGVYHVGCFTCAHCHSRLVPGDRYSIINGSLICEHDYPKVVRGHIQLPLRSTHKVC